MREDELRILLSELRAIRHETEWLEFKVNKIEQLGEYISALSNSACLHNKKFAYIVYGIDDKTHRIVGTNFTINQKGKGNEDLIPWIARLLEPRINFEDFEIIVEEKRVVIIKIQATNSTPVKFSGKSYIRIASYKKRLDDYPEKERQIWAKQSPIIFEKQIALQGADADTVLGLIDYPSYFELTNSTLPTNRKGIFEKLLQEKLIVKNGIKYDITNLGALLFAKRLEEFETLERKSIRVIIYEGKNRLRTTKEQIGRKGYASGFSGLVGYINNLLPMNEEIGKVFRKEVKMYPEIAIRELVANAIIHQDFSEKGTGPMIEVFADRVEITNPGKPLISVMRFVDHNPQSRNEKLAYFMRRLNICEERGTGIDKVISECEYYQLPAPRFIEEDNYTKIILYSYKTLRQMSKDDKIRACYLHACLKDVAGERMTNQSLRERFGIEEKNYSTASRIISETLKSELIKHYDSESNSKKHAKYIPFWA